jgi:hypothetical protein
MRQSFAAPGYLGERPLSLVDVVARWATAAGIACEALQLLP